jgi:hypothetical protein
MSDYASVWSELDIDLERHHALLSAPGLVRKMFDGPQQVHADVRKGKMNECVR